MLIRKGYFCGRRFRFQLYHAVWFMEEDEVKIHAPQGEVVERLGASEIDALAQAWHQDGDRTEHTLSIAEHLDSSAASATAAFERREAGSRSDGQQHHRRAA